MLGDIHFYMSQFFFYFHILNRGCSQNARKTVAARQPTRGPHAGAQFMLSIHSCGEPTQLLVKLFQISFSGTKKFRISYRDQLRYKVHG